MSNKPEKLEAMSIWLQLNPPIQNPPKPTANVTMATTAAWLHPANWTQHKRMAGNSKPRSNRNYTLHQIFLLIQKLFCYLINYSLSNHQNSMENNNHSVLRINPIKIKCSESVNVSHPILIRLGLNAINRISH